MRLVKIPEKDLVRDVDTHLLMTTDKSKHDEYIVRKTMVNARRRQEQDINTLKEQVDMLKSDLSELKDLIKGLYSK